MHDQIQQHLMELKQTMQQTALWQSIPPSEQAFASTEPFAIDYMTANEWLQWIFIPRMQALCDSRHSLPKEIAISPYVEEALKEFEHLQLLLAPIIKIEQLLQVK